MDGATLLRDLRQLLQESSDTAWMNQRVSYDYLFEAAINTAVRTNCFTTTQSITTVEDTAAYNLNPDFLKLYAVDRYGRHFIKVTDDDSNDYFVYEKEYDSILLDNNETTEGIPTGFAIKDASAGTRLTGTTTSTGTLSNGESALVNSAAPFAAVAVGDAVHNTTDSSLGIVVATSTSSSVTTAMFDGTNNYNTSGDAYLVVPQGRMQLYIDPPSSTSGYTITVPYVQRPDPVYSPYRFYKFPMNFKAALVRYAAWMYKYRDREPNYGDAFYQHWERAVRNYGGMMNKSFAPKRTQYKVVTKKSASPGGSYR